MSAEHYTHHDADTRALIAEAEVRGAAEAWDEGYRKGNLDGYFGTRDEWEKNPHGTAHRDES